MQALWFSSLSAGAAVILPVLVYTWVISPSSLTLLLQRSAALQPFPPVLVCQQAQCLCAVLQVWQGHGRWEAEAYMHWAVVGVIAILVCCVCCLSYTLHGSAKPTTTNTWPCTAWLHYVCSTMTGDCCRRGLGTRSSRLPLSVYMLCLV